jgi:YfiH family protein
MPEITSPLLAQAGIEHGFLTDHAPGGRDSVSALMPRIATVKQVHGQLLLWTEKLEKRAREADALATFRAGLAVGVYSADCTPILVAAFAGERPVAVMAVHAGWRGTAQGIAEKSFSAFAAAAGEKGATRFLAAIGPCIGFESFEVGEEVVRAFPGSEERGLARFLRIEEERKKYLFNLPGENRRQLEQAASKAGCALAIDWLNHCTFREKTAFPSFRRDREKAGRILSYLSFAG